jgi:hypothetical protein
VLKGSTVILRPVREGDLEQLYAYHVDIDNHMGAHRDVEIYAIVHDDVIAM